MDLETNEEVETITVLREDGAIHVFFDNTGMSLAFPEEIGFLLATQILSVADTTH